MGKQVYYILAAFVVYTIAAINSIGFHHTDEHFQILEFAGLRLGFNQAHHLAWEYHNQIRATIQPFLAELLLRLIGVFTDNEMNQMLVIRWLTACFSLFSISYFVYNTKYLVKERVHALYYVSSYFLYFIPYIAVRFSSEMMSINFMLIALGILINQERKTLIDLFKVGALFGLTYLFRFQMVFMIVGIGAWLLLVKKSTLKQILILILGFTVILLLGTFLDYVFYGEWVFTTWNYFEANIINKVADSFGVSPWYYYFVKTTHFGPLSVLNVLLVLTLVVYVFKKPQSIILYAMTLFLIAHSYVGHKELRFVYMGLFLLPLPFSVIIGELWCKLRSSNWKYLLIVLFTFLILSNVVALFANMLRPANGVVKVYDSISNDYPNVENVYCLNEEHSLRSAQAGLKMSFYQRDKNLIEVSEVEKLQSGAILVSNQSNLHQLIKVLKEPKAVASSWFLSMNANNWMRAKDYNWYIYEKQ